MNRGAEAASEIDTPNAAIRPIAGDGEYRILVTSDAETQVIIRRGSAEISTPQGTTRVDAGQMITIAGTDNPQYKVAQAPPRDEWDNWNNDRNRAVTNADSWHKTNRYYVGSEDLDQYGRWTTVPDYGQMSVPSVGANWAPIPRPLGLAASTSVGLQLVRSVGMGALSLWPAGFLTAAVRHGGRDRSLRIPLTIPFRRRRMFLS